MPRAPLHSQRPALPMDTQPCASMSASGGAVRSSGPDTAYSTGNVHATAIPSRFSPGPGGGGISGAGQSPTMNDVPGGAPSFGVVRGPIVLQQSLHYALSGIILVLAHVSKFTYVFLWVLPLCKWWCVPG